MEKRKFRATFLDKKHPECQITIEFDAPFPVDKEVDYNNIAFKEFLRLVNTRVIKIVDVEPVEIKDGN
jgi:hypothetical protein